jgi:hypothetical protein
MKYSMQSKKFCLKDNSDNFSNFFHEIFDKKAQ